MDFSQFKLNMLPLYVQCGLLSQWSVLLYWSAHALYSSSSEARRACVWPWNNNIVCHWVIGCITLLIQIVQDKISYTQSQCSYFIGRCGFVVWAEPRPSGPACWRSIIFTFKLYSLQIPSHADLESVSDSKVKELCTGGHVFFNCMGTHLSPFLWNSGKQLLFWFLYMLLIPCTRVCFYHTECLSKGSIYDIPARLTKLAHKAGVPHSSVLTAVVSNPNSWSLYVRCKGQLEAILDRNFSHTPQHLELACWIEEKIVAFLRKSVCKFFAILFCTESLQFVILSLTVSTC